MEIDQEHSFFDGGIWVSYSTKQRRNLWNRSIAYKIRFYDKKLNRLQTIKSVGKPAFTDLCLLNHLRNPVKNTGDIKLTPEYGFIAIDRYNKKDLYVAFRIIVISNLSAKIIDKLTLDYDKPEGNLRLYISDKIAESSILNSKRTTVSHVSDIARSIDWYSDSHLDAAYNSLITFPMCRINCQPLIFSVKDSTDHKIISSSYFEIHNYLFLKQVDDPTTFISPFTGPSDDLRGRWLLD